MARAVFGMKSRTSNSAPSGVPQGTPGGSPRAAGKRPGLKLQAGDEMYLWFLLVLELLTMGYLRHHFKRYHGG